MGQKLKVLRHMHGLRPGQVIDVDDLNVDAEYLKLAVKAGLVERVGKDTAPGVETREAPAEPVKK